MGLLKNAVFSDMTSDYLLPCEPEVDTKVTIRIRTARENVERIFVICNDEKYDMQLERTQGQFDYYCMQYQLGKESVSYHFLLVIGENIYFYDRRGVSETPNRNYDFNIIPGFHTPDWAKGAVMYQIFVDRFCNGDTSNDVVDDEYVYIKDYVRKIPDWNMLPQKDDIRNFYGGDLQGIINKLDYLADLGVEVLYLNPIFVSPSNHKYDTQDYEHIDPHFGKIIKDEKEVLQDGIMDNRDAAKYIERTTDVANLEASDALFADLVAEAHKRGIRIILDGVFNHCGSFHKWMDKEGIYAGSTMSGKEGAYWKSESQYAEYFHFTEANWPNASYESWWGFDTLPKLNYDQSKELQEYILDIGRKWLKKPYCIDGWRLDVAADLGHSAEYNHNFWKAFRKAVKEENQDAIILAEHYGPAKDWLNGQEWDSVMNYDAFMEPVSWFLTGMEKHSEEYREDWYNNTELFWKTMVTAQTSFSQASLSVSMNELSNHDHSRFLTRTNHRIGRLEYVNSSVAEEGIDKAVMREAVAVQMTWPGAPTIYYGDEAGVVGFTDPDNRRTYPWGHEDQEMISYHKDMIRLHKMYDALKTGSIKRVVDIAGVLGYGRFNQEEHILVLINNNDMDISTTVSVWEIGVPYDSFMDRLLLSDKQGYTLEDEFYPVEDGKIHITMPAKSVILLIHIEKK